MKCPYCHYVSFEFLSACRKCSKDLSSHKSQFGIDFIEPTSLGILTFVAGGPAAVAQAVETTEEAASTFDTGDFAFAADADTGDHITIEEAPSGAMAGGGTDELKFDFEDTGGEISIPEITPSSEEVEAEVAAGSEMDAIASDSGFSLNLGDEFGGGEELVSLDESSASAPVIEGEDDISVSIGSEDEGGLIEMPEDLTIKPAEEAPIVIPSEEELTGIEFNFQEDANSTVEIKPEPHGEPKKGEESEFADLDLSLDDKDLFAKGDKDEIDLGDIDLKLGDDDMGLKF